MTDERLEKINKTKSNLDSITKGIEMTESLMERIRLRHQIGSAAPEQILSTYLTREQALHVTSLMLSFQEFNLKIVKNRFEKL